MTALRLMVAILALAAFAAPSLAQTVFTANLDAAQAGGTSSTATGIATVALIHTGLGREAA